MCCLKNEQETYEELNKKLPGIGDFVTTPDGLQGTVPVSYTHLDVYKRQGQWTVRTGPYFTDLRKKDQKTIRSSRCRR